MPERPKVGVGVYVIKDGKILLGHRAAKHGNGTWSPPGGHLEYGESFSECAVRETLEEAGIDVDQVRVMNITNDVYHDSQKHYITIHVQANHCCDQDPNPMIPEEIERWEWFAWNELPENLFPAVVNFIKAGYRPDGV